MQARVRIFGHSLHQSFVFLPLGLLAGSIGADVIYLVTHDASWATMAFRLMAGGLVAGVVAAPVGFIDWLAIPVTTRAHRIGMAHGLGNMVVLTLFLLSWLVRRGETHIPSVPALVLSFLGLALTGLTAWLGGEMVSRLGVGVSDTAHLNASSSMHPDLPELDLRSAPVDR
jgi:uncharacterized membrane protein